jgi:omega-6 fatty acid desaturase (delta-12 desaturase)
LVPLAALWYAVVPSAGVSLWLTAGVTLLMSLFLLRAFVLMHDCGHGSPFRSARLNKAFGFALGVVTGMPQFVWSRHHAYHHATNGNWEKYRGALNIRSVDEFRAMTARQQRMYLMVRTLWMAPFAGFVYLIFNPRFTWLVGSVGLIGHVLRRKIAQPGVSIKAHAAGFETRYWNGAEEYRHMSWNNAVLLTAWALMSLYMGPALFFTVYLVSLSLTGAAGLVLFTVQHNFEHSHATGSEGWDSDGATVHGTSYLIFPRWLGWFTADIAYHHVHHLSSRIPNYLLAECHNEYQHLFTDVTRIELSQIHKALKCILWDTRSRRIISVAEYRQLPA